MKAAIASVVAVDLNALIIKFWNRLVALKKLNMEVTNWITALINAAYNHLLPCALLRVVSDSGSLFICIRTHQPLFKLVSVADFKCIFH